MPVCEQQLGEIPGPGSVVGQFGSERLAGDGDQPIPGEEERVISLLRGVESGLHISGSLRALVRQPPFRL